MLKVELHRHVRWFLRREANEAEVNAFYRELHEIRADPVAMIERSEGLDDPEISRYRLRFFRFAGCIAVFEMSRDRSSIRVRQCRGVR